MSSVLSPQPTAPASVQPASIDEIKVISHSAMFYWWPIWLTGYVMALLTYLQGSPVTLPDGSQLGHGALFHPSHNLGVAFSIVFLLVLLLTHQTVRGVASLTVIVAILAVTFLFAWMDWWYPVLEAFGSLVIFMNLGFYLFVSSAIFLMWVLSVFIFDRLDYWKVRPGQLVHVSVFGNGEETFDTHGMSVMKLRADMFRHWVLGLGSGDLHIATTGARKADFVLNNVLFVGTKLDRIQELVSMKPSQAQDIVTVGNPM